MMCGKGFFYLLCAGLVATVVLSHPAALARSEPGPDSAEKLNFIASALSQRLLIRRRERPISGNANLTTTKSADLKEVVGIAMRAFEAVVLVDAASTSQARRMRARSKSRRSEVRRIS